MSYFYKFGYSTAENHGEITMMHEELFSEEQIAQITEDAYVYLYQQYKNKVIEKWESNPEMYDLFKENGINFENLFSGYNYGYKKNTGMQLYLESLGFKPLKYENDRTSWVFGWASADEVSSWASWRGPLTKRIQKRISKIGRN